MALYSRKHLKLVPVSEKTAPIERDIQSLTEANLVDLFDLQFVSSEFAHNNLRVDTLCFDPENKAFVIIEYKKDRSFSVIDQGFSYLALMLNNKAEFLIEYNERAKKPLRREDVNWQQSRVLFVSPFFTPHQKAAINFKNLPIELWEMKFYSNSLVEYKYIEPLETSEKIETVTGSKFIKEVTREIKTYDLEMHLKKGSDLTRHLFKILQEKILDLGEMSEKYLQLYVGYRILDKKINFVTIHFYKEKLQIYILIPRNKIDDPKKVTETIPKSYGWAKNLRRFNLRSEKEIPYGVELIRQAYEFNKAR
jgi:predicted transport protein